MMNQRPPLQGMANQMAQYGRYGDSMLVHMNPVEVQGIAALSPTGSLTTNPVTGQPEAFLPFLAPLLGSAFGSSLLGAAGAALGKGALGTALTGIAGNAALSSAIGSGLATTAATGDLKKGILSGITGYGLGQVMDAAQTALNPALEGAQKGLSAVSDAATQTSTDLATTQAELATLPSAIPEPSDIPEMSAALPPDSGFLQAQVNPAMSPVASPTADVLSASAVDPARLAKMQEIQGLESQLASQQAQQASLKGRIGDITRETSGFDRLKGLVQAPGAAGSQLIQPGTLATIGTGEGKRGEIEMQERFARDARFADREKEEALRRAQGNIMDAYRRLEQDYPGYKIPGAQTSMYASAGGITSVDPSNYMSNLRGLQMLAGGGPTVQNFNQGGRSNLSSDDYSDYMGEAPFFGPGTAADRQANIRGSQIISPEQLQGYRPGFGPEIMYFQTPTGTTPPGNSGGGGDDDSEGGGTGPGGGDGNGGSPRRGDGNGGSPGGGGGGGGGGRDPNPDPPNENKIDDTYSSYPNKGGGLGDFDYSKFAESETGKEAIGAFRNLMGIEDLTNALSRFTPATSATSTSASPTKMSPIKPLSEFSSTEEVLNKVESGQANPFASQSTDVTGDPYFMVAGQRYTDRDRAIAEARGLGDPGGIEYFSAEGELISGRPQFTAEQLEEQRLANERALADFRESQRLNEQRNAVIADITQQYGGQKYQSTIDPKDFYTIGSGALEGIKFGSFDDAKAALERANVGGRSNVTDVYDTSQVGMMGTALDRIKSSAGKEMFKSSDSEGRRGGVFATRNEAIKDMTDRGISRDRANRLVRSFAEGGETEMSPDQGTRIIDLAIAAVMGQLPEDQAEAVINRFVDEFGPEAFAILRRQVLQNNVPGAQTEGEIKGNGGGMDDKVPGMIGDQQPVAVSPGEFIVPADVVSGIGDGSTDAGVEELYGMMDRVRQDRTGTRQQPQPVNKAKVMPV